MLGFFEAEFQRRAIDENFARSIRPIGGPLVEQMAHQPEPCSDGVGIEADGTLTWDETKTARYVYVLETNAKSPGIPPNFDMPEGTIWRVDVPFDGTPLASGSVRYGNIPDGTTQRMPEDNMAPSVLESGASYYLYVLEDVAVPVARCLFVQP